MLLLTATKPTQQNPNADKKEKPWKTFQESITSRFFKNYLETFFPSH
jgi:hypothetical protein